MYIYIYINIYQYVCICIYVCFYKSVDVSNRYQQKTFFAVDPSAKRQS